MTAADPRFPGEIAIELDGGWALRFQSADSNMAGTSYVRFTNGDSTEQAYWSEDEWRDAPAEVMGAIMGLLTTWAQGPVKEF